jgi:hypothetical protein
MVSSSMIQKQSFINIGSGIQKLVGRDAQANRLFLTVNNNTFCSFCES